MKWNKIYYDEDSKIFEGLPEEGEYLFSFSSGVVEVCELCYDYDGWYLESGSDLSAARAWMPIPPPYREE